MPNTRALVLGLVFIVFLDFAGAVSFISLGQQGYENVLVRISDDVPSALCLNTIANVQVRKYAKR